MRRGGTAAGDMAGGGSLALLLALLMATSPSAAAHRRGRNLLALCEPGTTFLSGCNLCTCGYDGLPENCSPNHCFYETLVGIKACTPGRTFMSDCNICLCGINGKPQQCTKNSCGPRQVAESRTFSPRRAGVNENMRRNSGSRWSGKGTVCEPGEIFYKECDVCRCGDDGVHYLCTMLPHC